MSDIQDIRIIDDLEDPEAYGLSPLTSLDPETVSDCDELLGAMSRTAFGGRSLGEGLDVLQAMIDDPDCLVVGTFSGAMTVAKMGTLLCTMIDRGWLDVVVSTGALMAHGFIESMGMKHYKYRFGEMDDKELFARGFNRVYDTIEPESNFVRAEQIIRRVMVELERDREFSSETFLRAVGKYLHENVPGRGILKSAYRKGVPVYVPAFTDSELALDVAAHYLRRTDPLAEDFDPATLPCRFDPFMDLFSYTRKICAAKRIGIFTIGGGVPRNWAQQVAPFLEMVGQGVPERNLPVRRFHYGVRICPEPVHWGGLSGCTYQEGVSWGKFVPPASGGMFAEVPCDATIAWPLLVRGVLDRERKKKRQCRADRHETAEAKEVS
jgi:deoxyhypusine synthase